MSAGVLLLAAGKGHRFGSDKRLALCDGRPLLQVVVERIRRAQLPLLVCLKPDDTLCEQLLNGLGVEYCYCPEARHGIGHTLAQGLGRAPGWEATLIGLADMPWISSDTWRQIAAESGPEEIVAPVHAGQRGHPVAFGERFYPQLESLSGDDGAREVVRRNEDSLRLIPSDDPGVLLDVDRPGDLA